MVGKSFLFRCKWFDNKGEIDGYTYSIDKRTLLTEINRRRLNQGDNAVNVRPVMVNMELYKEVSSIRNGFYSTVRNPHPMDLRG